MSFEAPKGAAADLKELEYISALHQTGDVLRRDGSIRGEDVARYLISRHGIQVDPEYVEDRIFNNGFSAEKQQEQKGEVAAEGVEQENEQFLDLAEIVAALLIPELIKASRSSSELMGEQSTIIGEEKTEADFDSKFEYDEYIRRKKIAVSLKPPPDIIGNVLDSILEEAKTNTTNTESPSSPPILDADLIRTILLHHGEKTLANDNDLINSMIEMASAGGDNKDNNGDDATSSTMVLDKHTFARALVGDVQDTYRLEDDLDVTTIYYDVFKEERSSGLADCLPNLLPPYDKKKKSEEKDSRGAAAAANTTNLSDPPPPPPKEGADPTHAGVTESDEDPETPQHKHSPSVAKNPLHSQEVPKKKEEEDNNEDDKDNVNVKSAFTFPNIDYMADTFRSQAVAVTLWTFFLTHLLASGSFGLQDFPQLVPTELESCTSSTSIGCYTVGMFLTWVNTVFTMALVGGLVIVGIGSMGNSVVKSSIVLAIVSLAPVIYFITKMFSFGTSPSDYGDEIHRSYALVMSLIIGIIYLFTQTRNILYVYLIPKSIFRNHMRLEGLFVGGQVRSEAYAKQAASHKTNLMMKNAYEVSCTIHESERRNGYHHPTSQSIFGFMKKDWELEKKGGYWWTWRNVWSHDLTAKEGIRVSSRLIAGNVIQFIIILYMILFTRWLTGDILERYEAMPANILVTTVKGAAGWIIRGIGSQFDMNSNSSITLKIADGTINVIYDELLPSLSNLTSGACSALFSTMNISQAEEMCSAASLYSDEVLIGTCASNASSLIAETGVNNGTIDMAMACLGVDALGGNANLLSTICSGGMLVNLYALCSRADMNVSGLPSADTMKSLVRVSLSQSFDGFNSFLRGWFDSGVQLFSTVVNTNKTIQPWMIQMAFGLGGLLAFFAAIYLSAMYFPSIVSTTLKFRSGVYPSLRDPNFSEYRRSVHWVTLIMGGMFWGTLLYCAAIIFVVAVIVLAVCYIIENPYLGTNASAVVGWILGTIVAYLVQASLFLLCGLVTYRSFYRNRPAAANAFSLLWESAWLGLTIFVVILRMVKLIVVGTLEVGRFDKPFLAEGVGRLGPVNLDAYPRIFRQDILSHEAHLHPYIERLGKMYLMKIRHGDKFATRAGSAWRILFVVALMPWFRSHRMLARPDLLPKKAICNESPPGEDDIDHEFSEI